MRTNPFRKYYKLPSTEFKFDRIRFLGDGIALVKDAFEWIVFCFKNKELRIEIFDGSQEFVDVSSFLSGMPLDISLYLKRYQENSFVKSYRLCHSEWILLQLYKNKAINIVNKNGIGIIIKNDIIKKEEYNISINAYWYFLNNKNNVSYKIKELKLKYEI